MRSGHGFTFSEGNSKMNKVVSFSVMPVETCAKGVPCVAKCYARRIAVRRPTVRESYERNTKLLREEGGCDALVADAVALCTLKKTRLFRWNVAGDFFCKDYLKAACRVAEACPDLVSWAFTKQFGVLDDFLKEEGNTIPENLNIVLSVWGDAKPPEELTARFGQCYMGDKKSEFEIPDDAFVCQGDCEHCLKCAKIKGGECVVIHEH